MTRIVDIKNRVNLHHSDKFFIDTNVWFWLTYAASNEIQTQNAPVRYQLERYPEFIEKILDEGANIYHSPLALSELANIIERTEYDIYQLKNTEKISRKDFRRKKECRKKVMEQISDAWKQIVQMSSPLDITLNETLSSKTLSTLNQYCLDAYDAFYIESMSDYGVSNIVTDDCDFNGLDISLYTANNRLV
ncbi:MULTISPECIES: PIN domain-containing protein [Gammaproteobacteria]|uniref:PIN domain-containing protein n=1 Tax=Shewanella carassii TaxID=1987584 RepID=A0ABQ1T6P2_9GAMM|nr:MULTISPECIES: PIN domain-containing protein [Shewanella]MDL2194803.1 PIN domain-containing protein [Shewanella algae]TVO98339.1 hypothetical protein AYI86_09400 [Shewanella algae]GGE84015.1 hypothetical protein GCM10011520_25550 [Shewanella carassii]